MRSMLRKGLVLAALGATRGGFAGEPPRIGARSPSPAAGALYDQAVRSFSRKEDAYRRALVGSLRSPNRLERKLALERLEKLPDLVDASVVDALVPILEETTPLGPVRCAKPMERPAAGVAPRDPADLADALCLQEVRVSNGALAAKSLVGRPALPSIVAHVARKPGSVEAMLRSLGPDGVGEPAPILTGLAAKQPEAQAALLRLAIAARCNPGSPGVTLAPIADLQGSPSTAVSHLAGVAVIRLSACDPDLERFAGGARQRAVQSVAARLQDVGDHEVVQQLVLLGPAAASFVSPLVVRFDRTFGEPEETGAIIKILTAVGPSAVPALPSLVRVLGDRKRVSLWRAALAAIGSIGPGAASAKPAALDVLSEASTFIRPVAEALLRINARLDRKEFSRLDDAFHGICGSILSTEAPVHEQNAECSPAAAAIGHIASAGGYPFRIESR